MNITLDDTSPSLNCSPQWRRQPTADDHYFLKTYHASQSKGDTMTLTFEGSAVYIYGSRGPNHGNYSVQFDDFVQFFPGFSNDVKYQSLLFSRTFGSGRHNIVLTNQENLWLDVDFFVITIASTVNSTAADPGAFSSTVSPAPSPAISSSGSSTGAVQPNSSTTPANSSPLFFVLTVVLASLLGIFLLLLVAFCWWKRRKDFDDARELSFRHGHGGKPTAPTFSQEGSASDAGAARSSTLGNALLGILPGSRRRTSSPAPGGHYMPTSARNQAKKKRPSAAEGSSEKRGDGESMIPVSNFGERPRFPGGGRKGHGGESPRSDNGSTTELSDVRSWNTGHTSTPGMSSGSAKLAWGYTMMEKEPSRVPGSPTTAISNLSDGQLSQWTAKPVHGHGVQRGSLVGAPIKPTSPSDAATPSTAAAAALPRAPENPSLSNLTTTRLIAQRQQKEARSFSPARSDTTGYATSEAAAAFAGRRQSNRSAGSGGYAHLALGAAPGSGPQPLKPPPRTERDRERERLEKIEREERERQERLATARYDRVGAAMDRNRRAPAAAPGAPAHASSSSSSPLGTGRTGMDGPPGPPGNFDRDLELARAGSPANSARSTSARGTPATASVRVHTPNSDLTAAAAAGAPQNGSRAYTPDGGRFTPERYNGGSNSSGRRQERSYSPGVAAWDGRGSPMRL